MKKTGIVRNMDSLGRVVLPAPIRRNLGMEVGDPVEFLIDGDTIVIRKYDAEGDLSQFFDDIVRAVELRTLHMPAGQARDLRKKVDEMRSIARRGQSN